MHHPWRALRALADWTLHWAHLPGDLLGVTDYEARTITLDSRLNQHERRCTIDHEVEHASRGPVPDFYWPREEIEIDKIVARRLLPDIKVVADALAWACCTEEAADELWVDEGTLTARLRHLHPAERGYLTQRLAD